MSGIQPPEPIGTDIPAGPLAVLQRMRVRNRAATAEERCEMCAEPIDAVHPHVVNVGTRSLLCSCRACYLLFTQPGAAIAYRAVPDRYLSFAALELDDGRWDDLQIPVGVAFFFLNSALGKMVAFYPSPAGATESTLPLGAWDDVVKANPALATLLPDVEAILVRRTDEQTECFLVPIDSCYELVGHLRRLWRGFDGGAEARKAIDEFFDRVRARSRLAPASTGESDVRPADPPQTDWSLPKRGFDAEPVAGAGFDSPGITP
jgi:hypothetical protein